MAQVDVHLAGPAAHGGTGQRCALRRRRLPRAGTIGTVVGSSGAVCATTTVRGRAGLADSSATATAAGWATSKLTNSLPTATVSPMLPCVEMIRPSMPLGIVTVALSVITSTSGWSTWTCSPGCTCQATISASTTPSPKSGSLKMMGCMVDSLRGQAASERSTACLMRSRLGMYCHSWAWGNGVSQPVTRSIGDSRL